jgi:sugar lactone lactonase YvrE
MNPLHPSRVPPSLFVMLLLPLASVVGAQEYQWTTFAGNSAGVGISDGPLAQAHFNRPNATATDAAGNVYVADTYSDTIRKISVDGTVSTLAGSAGTAGVANGIGTAAQFDSPEDLAVDAAGNVFVCDTSNHMIRKITPGGVVTTFAGGPNLTGSTDGTGTAARFYSPRGLAIGAVGTIYVADSNNHTIRRITAAGVVTTLAGTPGSRGSANGTGSAARFSGPNAIALDAAGNLFVADVSNNLIRKVTPAGVVTTFAGGGGFTQSGYTDAVGTAARFAFPQGLAFDAAGNLFVADSNNRKIRRITPAAVVTTFAGSSQGYEDGLPGVAKFDHPQGLAIDAAGNLYVPDDMNHAIRKVTPAGAVTTLTGGRAVFGVVDTDRDSRFNLPSGMARDSGGNLYVADRANHIVRRITPDGAVTTIAGMAGQSGSTDGPPGEAKFSSPLGIVAGSDGTVYVADSGNHTIRRILPDNTVDTLAGSPGISGTANGQGGNARFRNPSAVGLDAAGQVYVADTGNHTVRRITPEGVVSTAAGNAGVSGSVNGTGSGALFSGPSGLTSDGAGNLYVADTGNHTIRRVTVAGLVTTLAGSAGLSGIADGTGGAARFQAPRAIAFDGSSNLIVADTDNHTIRRVTPGGVVTTYAGNAGYNGLRDFTGTSARFDAPSGVVASGGNIYVGDSNNHVIRLINPAAGVTIFAGRGGVSGSADGMGSRAEFGTISSVTMDAAGNLYATESWHSIVRKITPAGRVTTLAGYAGFPGSTDSAGTSDGTGRDARFGFPGGIVADAGGNLYVADTNSHTIRKVTLQGVVTTLAGSPGTGGSVNGAGSVARFSYPSALAMEASGNLIVADRNNHTIRRVTPAGVVTTVAGSPGNAGTANGTGSAARFDAPFGVAVDAAGNILVADRNNHTIRRISPAGVVTTPYGAAGTAATTDGPAATARFSEPYGVAVDRLGNILVMQHTYGLVRKISPAGVVSTIGGGISGNGGGFIGDGYGNQARFSAPSAAVVSSGGVIYLADSQNSRIVRGIIAPVAHPQTYATDEDTPAALTLTGNPGTGATLAYTITAGPLHGTLTGTPPALTWSPAPNYHGPDSFTFVVNDGNGDSGPATVSLTVRPVNDAPLAIAQTLEVDEDNPLAVTLAGTDVENDPLSYVIVTGPAHGTVTGTGAARTYTPAVDYNGPDSFTFTTSDGSLDSEPVTVALTVRPVNDAPSFTAALPEVNAGPSAPDAAVDLFPLLRDPDNGDTHTWRITATDNPAIFARLEVNAAGLLALSYALYSSGVSRVTVEVADAAGARASLTFSVTLPELPLPQITAASGLALNRQTGLWEQTVTVQNTAGRAIGGFTAAVTGLPSTACLYNASECQSANPLAGYYRPLAAGESVTMILEYFSPSRSALLNPAFTMSLALPQEAPVSAPGGLAVDRILALPDRAVLIEFTAVPGHLYLVQYSDDAVNWKDSLTRLRAPGNRVQWIDRGAPRTDSPPGETGSRWYRVKDVTP